jgi:hypothetical protein
MTLPPAQESPAPLRARDDFSRELAHRLEGIRPVRSFFARRGTTSPLGKVMSPLGTLRLRGETEAALRAAAARQGMPVMEFVREVLEVGLHGREEVERRHTLRLDAIELVTPKRIEKESAE